MSEQLRSHALSGSSLRRRFSPVLLILCWSISTLPRAAAQTPFWEPARGVPGFTVSALAIDARDHLFAGGDSGLYRSQDGGKNWTVLPTGGARAFFSLLVTRPGAGPERIFAGSGGAGLLISNDDGDHWTGVLPGRAIHCLGAGETAHILAGTDAGLFRSTNGGAEWIELSTGLEHPVVRSIAANAAGEIYAGMDGAGVYYSSDGGDTWTERNGGLFNPFIRALAFNRNGDLVAATYGGIYVSNDKGLQWSAADLNADPTQVYCLLSHSSGVLLAGAFRDIILASYDGGHTWYTAGNLLVNGFFHRFLWALAENSTGIVYGGSEGGVYVTSNLGKYWNPLMGSVADAQVTALIGLPNGDILAGVTTAFLLRSTDMGDNWSRSAASYFVATKRCFHLSSWNVLYAGTDSGVYRSSDLGTTWARKDTGLTNYYVTSLATTGIGHVFAATETTDAHIPHPHPIGGMYRSRDDCENWTLVNNGLTNHRVHAVIATRGGDLFAGTDDGIFRSKNDGDLWFPVNNGLDGRAVNLLATDSAEHIFAVTEKGMFRSSDAGALWLQLTSALTGRHLYALSINALGHLYAGTNDSGVYRSTDAGLTWNRTNEGLTFTDVRAFAAGTDGRMYAGTFGGGVFRSIRSTTGMPGDRVAAAPEFRLSPNYPNPFYANSTLPFSVGPRAAHVTAELFDLLGRKIRTIADREFPPGEQRIALDAAGLQSGAYLIRLRTGDASRIVRISVVR